ncbi:MAG: sulfatase-like hydrolase/transferase [Actinobacteria bacterium]|nr:sulfatase-like hydrolase/transferase [Actinomycetota bacterium]
MLSLLVPFVIYNLALKAYGVASRPGDDPRIFQVLGLMRSDASFNLGYALLWIGLFAATATTTTTTMTRRSRRRRKGLLRWAVVVLFHATALLVVFVSTISFQYFKENGTSLDYGTVAEWLPKFNEIVPILVKDVPLLAYVLLAAALLYATVGPWLLTRAVEWWRGRPERPLPVGTGRISLLVYSGIFLLALGFFSLSVLTGATMMERDPVVNMAMTGVRQMTAEEDDPYANVTGSEVENPAANASLVQTPQTQKRNVVIIHLESTRAQSVTPYNEDLATTPYLDELSKESLLAERAYTIVPRTSKANVAVNCGVDPPLFPGPEFEPGGVPVPCLAGLLKDQGYSTAYFMSTDDTMDNFGDVVTNFGYDKFYSLKDMDTEGFQVTNTFGYEDNIMLKPSEEWLKKQKESGKPFLTDYLTGTGHYGYECSSLPTGFEDFAQDEELNRYLNCLHYLDSFVKNLIDQYKELGLYDNTIFVLYGDHGEGFGEHGRLLHGDTIYEEGLKIPLMIHAPGMFEGGQRVKGLSNETDVLPTVLEMLGYEVKDGVYPGYSLLHETPEDRTLNFSCISERKCLASIKGNEKYIYNYDNQPDEVFDLSEDPLEKNNLADEYSREDLDQRREDLLRWRSKTNAVYGG